jgi:hypothetical protein
MQISAVSRRYLGEERVLYLMRLPFAVCRRRVAGASCSCLLASLPRPILARLTRRSQVSLTSVLKVVLQNSIAPLPQVTITCCACCRTFHPQSSQSSGWPVAANALGWIGWMGYLGFPWLSLPCGTPACVHGILGFRVSVSVKAFTGTPACVLACFICTGRPRLRRRHKHPSSDRPRREAAQASLLRPATQGSGTSIPPPTGHAGTRHKHPSSDRPRPARPSCIVQVKTPREDGLHVGS